MPSRQYCCFRSLFLLTALLAVVILSTGCASRRAPIAAAKPTQATPASLTVAPNPTADQVRTQLTEAIQTTPNDPQAWLELALFYRNINDLLEEEQQLRACWQRFPHFARAPYYLGLLYMTHGRDADAVAPLEAAAALAPHDPIVQVNAGLACFRTAQQAPALRHAHTALRIDPRVPETYMLLARLYDHHGTANLALADLQTYLRYSPNPAPGYYLLGRINASQANREKALLWTQRAVAADPKNVEFLVTLGRIYYEMFYATHAQDGIHCFQQALDLDPNNSDAHLYLGRVLVGQHQWTDAVTQFQAALRTATNTGPGYYDLAHWSQMTPSQRAAADTGPIYYDLGQALVKAGRVSEGQKALEIYNAYREYTDGIGKLRNAVAVAPLDRAARYALARFCLRYRQYDQAMTALQDAVRKFGQDDTLERLMAEAQAGQSAVQRVATPPNAGSGDMSAQPPDSALMPALSPPSAGTASPSPFGGADNGR